MVGNNCVLLGAPGKVYINENALNHNSSFI